MPRFTPALSRFVCLSIVVVAAIAATGCATRSARPISDRFVRQGKPTVDYGGAPPTPTAAYVAQLRKLAEEAKPRATAPAQNVAEVRDPALRDRLAALKATPTAAAHRDVAIEYRRLKIFDAAYKHLSAAIRLAPSDASAYDQRARVWREWRLPQLGLTDAARAVSLAPTSATAWNTLGLLLEESGRRTHGIRAFQRAVALDDRAAWAWNNLCHVRTLTRETDAAIRACRKTLELAPETLSAQVDLHKNERLMAPTPPPQLQGIAAEGPAPRQPADEQP